MHPNEQGGSQPVTSPLAPEHFRVLADAQRRSRKVRRAAVIATISGWTLAFFAFITLLSAIFGDWGALALGTVLAIAAFNEIRGGAMIRRFNPAGSRLLGLNQLALGLIIVAYAGWSLWDALHNPVLASAGGTTGDANLDELVNRWNVALAWGIYGGIAGVGVVGPGLTAWYYFSRAKLVRGVLEQTPAWAIQTIRAAA